MIDIFAAADHSFGPRQSAQFVTQFKTSRETAGEFELAIACRRECTGVRCISGSRHAGDSAFNLRLSQTADAGRLTDAIDVGNGCALQIVNFDESIRNLAAQRRSELGVGDQMKARRQHVNV